MKAKTLAEALGVKGTLVMSEEQAKQYAFDRKLADPNKQPELFGEQVGKLRGVIIHNAKTEEEVRYALTKEAGLVVVEYKPPKSTEPHLYAPATGHIHVVNSRGVTRLRRDEALATVLQYVLPQDVRIDVSNHANHRRTANNRFEDFAFKLVDDVFTHLNKDAVASNGRLNILLGLHSSLDDALESNDFEVVHDKTSDYLNYRLIMVKTLSGAAEAVVNFDYIFADQAKDVLHKLYKGVIAEFSRQGIDIHLFHYGKVGILSPAIDVGEIVLPTGAFDEEKLQYAMANGQPLPSPYQFKNQLVTNPRASKLFYLANAGRIHSGVTVNTNSVLEQTVEGLERDLLAGGHSLDMEWIVMASLNEGSESTYPGLGNIRIFFAGIGSDKPLEGQTLGNTEYH